MTEAVTRRVANELEDVWSLDIDPLVCPDLPACDPVEALAAELRQVGAIG